MAGCCLSRRAATGQERTFMPGKITLSTVGICIWPVTAQQPAIVRQCVTLTFWRDAERQLHLVVRLVCARKSRLPIAHVYANILESGGIEHPLRAVERPRRYRPSIVRAPFLPTVDWQSPHSAAAKPPRGTVDTRQTHVIGGQRNPSTRLAVTNPVLLSTQPEIRLVPQ